MLRLLALLVRMLVSTRRTLAGWVAYAAVLTTVYVAPGPLDELYPATAVALVAVSVWVVVAGFVTDRSAASMLAAAAGGPLRFHLLQTAAGAALALPMAVVAVVAGRVVAGPLPAGSVLVPGVCLHLVAVLLGAGVGAVAARPVVRDVALSLVVAVVGFVLVVVPAISPLHAAVDSVTPGAGSLGRALLWLAAALVWVAALAVGGGLVAARRRAYGGGATP